MKSKWHKNKKYSTVCEMKFIRDMGTVHYSGVSPSLLSRKERLQLYLEAAKNRHDWDKMEKDIIIAFAKEELRKES